MLIELMVFDPKDETASHGRHKFHFQITNILAKSLNMSKFQVTPRIIIQKCLCVLRT